MTATVKFGPHCLRPTADAIRFVQAGARLAKLVNDFGPAAEMLAANPGLLIIGRQISVYPEDPGRVVTAENLRHLDPVLAARKFVGFQQRTYELNSLIKFWEGLNEPSWEVQDEDGSIDIAATVANYQWYGDFEEERVRLLAIVGLRAVVGNFSVGTPDIGLVHLYAWAPMITALRAAYFQGGLLGLHEYEFGIPFSQGSGWLSFRYRKVHDWFLVPNGLGDLPIVLTEFGSDFKIRDWDYVEDLKWAENEMRKDPYLLGATLFTFGSTNEAWDNFNLADTPEADTLIEWAATTPPIDSPPDDTGDLPDTGDDMPPTTPTNLLVNPDLFSGGTHTLPGHDNMRVADGFQFTWKEGMTEALEHQTEPFKQPEMKYHSADGAIPNTEPLPTEEWPLYLASDVPVVYHVMLGWGPQWWKLYQQINLAAGRYLLSAQLYPDIYFATEGAREWANDPLSGEWRLIGEHAVLGSAGNPWLNGATTLPLGVPPRHQFGRWVQLTQEWDHPGGVMSVGLEFRARYGVDVVGAFVRRFSLIQVNVAGETPDSTVGIVSKLDSIIASAQEAKSQLQQAIRLLS